MVPSSSLHCLALHFCDSVFSDSLLFGLRFRGEAGKGVAGQPQTSYFYSAELACNRLEQLLSEPVLPVGFSYVNPQNHMHKLANCTIPWGLLGRDVITRPCSTLSHI
jgi:hypothetical protein